jgi:hypothetical protein
MSDYDDLREYDGDPTHDMWVDSDYDANTDELDFVDDDTEDYDEDYDEE